MRKLTKKEYLDLGEELGVAKIKVLVKWGFSTEEIAKGMELPKSVIRRIIKKHNIKQNEES